MSVPQPSPHTPTRAPRISPLALRWIAIAFAAGLGLFLLLWLDARNEGDFYRADGTAADPAEQQFEPLPVPLPAGEAPNLPPPSALPEPIAGPPPEPVAPPPPAPPPAAPTPMPPPAVAGGANTGPVPIDRPPPSYPVDALRDREQGTVLLKVMVGADGHPYGIEILRSSGSRSLDRAGRDAVRRWRFRPAMENGRAVSASVNVPIDFSLGER